MKLTCCLLSLPLKVMVCDIGCKPIEITIGLCIWTVITMVCFFTLLHSVYLQLNGKDGVFQVRANQERERERESVCVCVCVRMRE